jgi:hypothetical protein
MQTKKTTWKMLQDRMSALPPRGTRGSPQNIERMVLYSAIMHEAAIKKEHGLKISRRPRK